MLSCSPPAGSGKRTWGRVLAQALLVLNGPERTLLELSFLPAVPERQSSPFY